MIQIPIVSTNAQIHPPNLVTSPFLVAPFNSEEKKPRPSLRLEALVRSIPSLPMQTAILGTCLDGSPILFDLKDPRPGPILLVGDPFCGKTALLKTIAQSLMMTNRPYEVDFNVISAHPQEWTIESSRYSDYFPVITSNYERSAGEAILNICDLVESRQHGKRLGACRLLLLDGLDTLPYMDFDVRLNFEWLLQEGPSYQVWPVVAVTTAAALNHPQWIKFFRTRVAGYVENQKTGRELSLLREIDLTKMDPGQQFAVRVGREGYPFWLPESDGTFTIKNHR